MIYLTEQHTQPQRHVEQDGMLHPTSPPIAANDSARLAELGIYRHITEDGEAPLGYSAWAEQSDDDGTYYARTRLGTDAERDAAMLEQQRAAMLCTDLQAFLAIDMLGMANDYEAWAADQARTFAEHAFVNRAKIWRRTDPVFNAAADALGKTEEEKDSFFALAVTL